MLVPLLSSRGEQFRAMSRDPQKAASILGLDVEVVQGDFEVPESVISALVGVDRVFFLSHPGPHSNEETRNFAEAMKKAGVQRIVRISGLTDGIDSPLVLHRWHSEAEQNVIESGIPYTILRPTSFMQNHLGSARSIASEGVIHGMLRDGKVGYIDTRDIAEVAACALTADGHEGKTYVITGPESLSMNEIADKLSAVAGREVKYVNLPPEEMKDLMVRNGRAEYTAASLVEWQDWSARGGGDVVTDSVKVVTGREPISYDQFLQDFASTFSTVQT